MPNVDIMCPRCAEIVTAAVKVLEWIRCPRCHLRVFVTPNLIGVSEASMPRE